MKFILPLFLLTTLLLAPQVQAERKKEVKVSFKTTRFDPADRPPPAFSTQGGTTFKVPLHNISEPIKATLREGKFLDLKNSGKTITIEVSESMLKDLLLIFIPTKDSYHIMPILTPVSKLGGGSRLLVNATGTPLGIKYGKQKPLVLHPKKRTILIAEKNAKMTPLLVSIKKGDQWKLVRSERWPNDRRFRSFVFFYKKPGSSRLRVHAIPDRIQIPK